MIFTNLFFTFGALIFFISTVTALPAEHTIHATNFSMRGGPNTLLGKSYTIQGHRAAAGDLREEGNNTVFRRRTVAFPLHRPRENILSHQVQAPAHSSSAHTSVISIQTPNISTTTHTLPTTASIAKRPQRKKTWKGKAQMKIKDKYTQSPRRGGATRKRQTSS